MTRAHGWAVGSCLAYGALSLGLGGGGVPFVRFPAFQFPVAREATAVPLFLADGERADVRDYTAFAGVGPDDVDVRHEGYACSVEHKLHEQRAWLAENAGEGGPVRVEIGLLILSLDEAGRLVATPRVDATGTARPR
ncbi:MAG: hypothetical protein ACOZNI_36575 [Myxococcota bacterium]